MINIVCIHFLILFLITHANEEPPVFEHRDHTSARSLEVSRPPSTKKWRSMSDILDTGSDVAWIPCAQCQGCDSTTASPFDSTLSSSYNSLDCNSQECQQAPNGNCGENYECDVQLSYGDGSVVGGPLSSDAITPLYSDAIALGSQSLFNFSFACAESVSGLNQNQPGLMGLGGGPL